MRVTMIKKQFQNEKTCQKCAQAEELLRRRGLWNLIDAVEWAVEGDPSSPGMKRAAEHDIALAPFFVVETPSGTRLYSSVLKLINEVLDPAKSGPAPSQPEVDPELLERELAGASPQEIVERALSLFGKDCVVAFSGAEDVILIDLAKKTGHPFRVLTLDTARLHPETYRFLDRVREHFGIPVEVVFPDAVRVEELVRSKGLFSFYADGHSECCHIRKVMPLRRGLVGARAWITGQRRDQSPTRSDVRIVSRDLSHGTNNVPLVKWNPLSAWSLGEVWNYIRENELPYNALHDQGYVSIGCEPCTRAVRPGEHERAGRWWWEEATQRECGLHVAGSGERGTPRAAEAATTQK